MMKRKILTQSSNAVTLQEKPVLPLLLIGLGGAIFLGGGAAWNPAVSIAGLVVLLGTVLLLPRPIWIIYGLAFAQPLLGGFARGVGIPFLRLGQAVLVLGCVLFLLAAPSRQGKFRLTALDVAFALFFVCEAVLPVLAIYYQGGSINWSDTGFYDVGTPLQTALGPLQYYLLYRIVVATISSAKQITIILNLSFLSSIFVSIIGILQKLEVGPVSSFLSNVSSV